MVVHSGLRIGTAALFGVKNPVTARLGTSKLAQIGVAKDWLRGRDSEDLPATRGRYIKRTLKSLLRARGSQYRYGVSTAMSIKLSGSRVFGKSHVRPLWASLPAFLVPFACNTDILLERQIARFSTSQRRCYPRDMNRQRGVSALRSTGLRQPLSISKEPLPQPVLDPERRSKVPIDEEHGLWQFFNKQKAIFDTPEDHHAHGMDPANPPLARARLQWWLRSSVDS